MRYSAASCRLGLACSDDEGRTWSELVRTDFPNTNSRAFAGRLSDGRLFDRQYTLIGGNTTRRINGRHKEDGYQYPSCCIDGDKLLVIYSVNKEDIEVGTVDMSKVD